MDDPELKIKLDNLDERINNARKEETSPPLQNYTKNNDNAEAAKTNRIGSELIASIVAGWIVGLGIDWVFSIKPWGMIGFMVLGFISGVYRADQAMKKSRK